MYELKNNMSKQEVFDYVCNHLITQNVRSVSDTICAYRGDNNCKCAVGCMIKDEEYKPFYERRDVYYLLRTEGVDKNLINRIQPHAVILTSLQHIHDRRHPNEWLDELKILAIDQDLKFNYDKTV